MAVYSKETALFDKGAINDDILDAGKKATSFLSVDGTGVMVYDGSKGPQMPSSPSINTSNVLIDPDSLDVRMGTVKLATFGTNSAQIGKDSGEHITITADGIDFYKIVDSVVEKIFRLGTVGQQAAFTSKGGYMTFDVDDNNASGTIQIFTGTTNGTSGYEHVDNISFFDINANSDNGCTRVSMNSPNYARSLYTDVDPIVLNVRIGDEAFLPTVKLLELAEDGNILIKLNESAASGTDKEISDVLGDLDWSNDVIV